MARCGPCRRCSRSPGLLAELSRRLSIAPSASARLRGGTSTRSGGSAFSISVRSLTPMPSRRYFVPSVSFSSRCSPVWKMRSARRVGSPSWRLRVRSLKSCVFSFSTTVRPAMPRFLQPRRDLFGQCPQHRHEILRRGEVDVEGGLGRHALGVAIGLDDRARPARASRW